MLLTATLMVPFSSAQTWLLAVLTSPTCRILFTIRVHSTLKSTFTDVVALLELASRVILWLCWPLRTKETSRLSVLYLTKTWAISRCSMCSTRTWRCLGPLFRQPLTLRRKTIGQDQMKKLRRSWSSWQRMQSSSWMTT